jgi:hypothetical protein
MGDFGFLTGKIDSSFDERDEDELEQVQFLSADNSFVAVVNIQLAVDALDVRPDCAGCDAENIGNFGAGEMGIKIAKDFKFSFAQRLD